MVICTEYRPVYTPGVNYMPGSHFKYKFLDIKSLIDMKQEISGWIYQCSLVNVYKEKKVRMTYSDAACI